MQPFKPFRISFWRFLVVLIIAALIAGTFYYWLYSNASVNIDPSMFQKKTSTDVSKNKVNVPAEFPGLESSYVPPDSDVTDPSAADETENATDKIVEDISSLESDTSSVEIKTMTNDTLAYHILQRSGLVVLDLRSAADFAAGRIRYSKNYNAKTSKASDFKAGTSYLLLCSSGVCEDAKTIIGKLPSTVNVQVLEKGYDGWIADGFKVLKSDEPDAGSAATQTSTPADTPPSDATPNNPADPEGSNS